MQPKYFEDSYLFKSEAEIISYSKEDDFEVIQLNDTIFYPQGGGQPCDQGFIVGENFEFQVKKVKKEGHRILHFGESANSDIKKGKVELNLNEGRRKSHSAIHSAGHMLDVAMLRLGLGLLPTKGYHFPDSPYVEYAGIIEENIRHEIISKLNLELQKLISESHVIQAVWVHGKDQVANLCPEVPNYLDFSQEIRIVTIADDLGCPCAGTHIKNTNELTEVTVNKIKCKKGNTRISYSVLNQI